MGALLLTSLRLGSGSLSRLDLKTNQIQKKKKSIFVCIFAGCMYSGGINSSWFAQFHDLQGRGHLSIASVSLLGGEHQNYGNEDELCTLYLCSG